MVTSSGQPAVVEEKQSFMLQKIGERAEFEDMRVTLKSVTKTVAGLSVIHEGQEKQLASKNGEVLLPNGTKLVVHITKVFYVTFSRPPKPKKKSA